ncbi:hypothetical protein SVIOM74S_02334 [Streptomyces violarus]
MATWQELTGIHIDHFVMVDFAGVVSMADAVGGVPVCVDANIHSRDSTGHGSGLKLAKGTHPVKGKQALQWLRTRYGFEDGSDLARAKAQHMYLNSMVRVLRENATLSSPNRLRRLAEEATAALTVDPGLDSVKKLYDLSNELRTRKPSASPSPAPTGTRAPASSPPRTRSSCSGWCARTSRSTARTRRRSPRRSRSPRPTRPHPTDLAVQVRNGTSTDELGTAPGRANTVTGRLADQFGDGGSHIGTAGHREAAPLAEVVLHVYDDQGAAHGRCPSAMRSASPAGELPSLLTWRRRREGARLGASRHTAISYPRLRARTPSE